MISKQMKNRAISNNRMLKPYKNLILWVKSYYICTNKTFTTYSNCFSLPESYITKDNRLPRLTSVAHLGGILFSNTLEI